MRIPLAILTSLALAAPIAIAQDGTPAKKPRLDLRATPRVAFSPVRVHVTAVLVGGDPTPEYHCPTLEWDWDDGSKSLQDSDCDPYEPGTKIDRRFSSEHYYSRAGSYNIRAALRAQDKVIAANAFRLVVRQGIPTDRGGQP